MKRLDLRHFSAYIRIGVICVLATAFASLGYAQDIPGVSVSTDETIPAGSIIIPMDDHQNTGANSRFNLKAYGLLQRLLQNNIPVKWAILNGKTKDAPDFSASVRALPLDDSNPVGAATSMNLAGGPFIIPAGYETIARQVIKAVRNNETPANNAGDHAAQNIVVYVTSAATTAPIRYTVVHKPKIAIGQNTGVTSGVHQKLYDFALVNDYANVDNTTLNGKSCYTIATQPHFESAGNIGLFNDFLASGGNVLLQCLSITTFENDPSGRFQTTNGWAGYSNGTTGLTGTPKHANVDMPFAQFIGNIPGDITAAVDDYDLKNINGTTHNNFFKVEYNDAITSGGSSNRHPESYIASQAVVPTNNTAGGAVFELGGHDYFQSGTNVAATNYNAQRMILNALFVPAFREGTAGAPCNLTVPQLFSYKSVKLTTDANGNGLVSPGDTVTWTITYVNTTPIAFPDFQITDALDSKLTYVGPLVVTPSGGSTTATANGSFDGTGSNNMLTGGYLDIGGKIVVQIKTQIKGNVGVTTIPNQTVASGTNVSTQGVRSDALDSQTQGVQGGVAPPSGSIPQPQQTAGIDPTVVKTLIPTAAEATITGRVITSINTGISRAQITVLNAATGKTTVTYTNPFGYFTTDGLDVGTLYVVSVSHPSYTFPENTHSFVVNDNVSGLTFVASAPDKGGEPSPPINVKTKTPFNTSKPAPTSPSKVRVIAPSKRPELDKEDF